MSEQSSCPSCGTPNPAGAAFCAGCGAGVAQDVQSAESIPSAAPTAQMSSAASMASDPAAPTTSLTAADAPTAHYVAAPSPPPQEARGTGGGLMSQSRMMDALRRATLGDYEILSELGRGGMATVYLAHDISLDRKVAIKVMSPALLDGEGAVERFKREARTAGALSHPHIIPIHAVRESDDLLYFVMKYVEGRPLDSVIEREGALPIAMTLQILAEVSGALAYAHRKGVIHRDVKPANIMLDDDGWAVVTDFGIAKVVQAKGLTMTGTTVGTPAYMSPEQCMARDVTGRSDQYSLGTVAYEMLTGHVPFRADSLMEMFLAQMNDAPPPLLEARPDCPPRLAALVDRMIAKTPEDRWPALEDVAAALAGLQQPEARQRTRNSMMALARESDGRPRAGDFTRPISPTPLNTRRQPAGDPTAVTPAFSPAITPAPGDARQRRIPVWAWVALAVPVIAGGAWLASRDPTAAAPAAPVAALPVAALPVARVALTPEMSTIAVGTSAPLVIALRDSLDAPISGRVVTWTSANPDVATVDASGVVTAHDVGSARVTASSEGRSAIATVAVSARALVPNAITVLPRDSSVVTGARVSLVASVTAAGGANLIGTPVEWKSSAPGVATVDAATGLVTALKPGSATIAAIIKDGPRTSMRLTVTAPVAVVAAAPVNAAPVAADSARAPAAAPAAVRADSSAEVASGAPHFTEISAGGSTSCGALANDGGVLCWGGSTPAGAILQGVLLSKLAVGDGHLCGLTPGGEAFCWGSNSQGQLGDGTTTERDRPTAVKASQRFVDISVGAGHTCALAADGSAFCWGGNKYGQLGDGSRSNRSRPVSVLSTSGNQGFQSLAAGGSHTCGVTRANKAFCWGDGFSGQVGNAMQDFAKEPFAVKTSLAFRSVVAGDRHTCGLTTSGRVYCWGSNAQGQLGNETKDDRNVPDSVSTDQVFRTLGAGGAHTCGISSRRQLLCWGQNVDGRLGDGTRSGRTVPVIAAGGQSFSLVSPGSGHTCALATGGQAMCWGGNSRGQLGSGTASPFSAAPIVVKVRGA